MNKKRKITITDSNNTTMNKKRKTTITESKNNMGILSKLPKHVLETILLPKLDLQSFLPFSILCRCSKTISAEYQHPDHLFPWLMLSNQNPLQIRTFLNLSNQNLYTFQLPNHLLKTWCAGSSHGYLIMIKDSGHSFVLNPFSGYSITLPPPHPSYNFFGTRPPGDAPSPASEPRSSFYYVYKAVLSNNALVGERGGDCGSGSSALAAIGCGKDMIGICRLKDKRWFVFDHKEEISYFDDILHYNGRIYANYLVESWSGDLLLVHRRRKPRHTSYETTEFLVFRLDESNHVLKWVKVESLGDQVVFLGKNSSKCVSSKKMSGFRGNCIYFTDDNWHDYRKPSADELECKRWDIGVFYLDDGSIESFFPTNTHSIKFPPIWV